MTTYSEGFWTQYVSSSFDASLARSRTFRLQKNITLKECNFAPRWLAYSVSILCDHGATVNEATALFPSTFLHENIMTNRTQPVPSRNSKRFHTLLERQASWR